MALRQLVVSDISGQEVSEDQHARLVIEHPDFPGKALELDATVEEAEKFKETTLRLAGVVVYAPNVPPRAITLETKVLDRLFTGVDFNKVLEGARASTPAPAAPRKKAAAKAAAPAGDKVDYTSPTEAGKLHRGRLTDAEKDWVKANREQASYNREQQTGKPIDFDDPAEKKRYGID